MGASVEVVVRAELQALLRMVGRSPAARQAAAQLDTDRLAVHVVTCVGSARQQMVATYGRREAAANDVIAQLQACNQQLRIALTRAQAKLEEQQPLPTRLDLPARTIAPAAHGARGGGNVFGSPFSSTLSLVDRSSVAGILASPGSIALAPATHASPHRRKTAVTPPPMSMAHRRLNFAPSGSRAASSSGCSSGCKRVMTLASTPRRPQAMPAGAAAEPSGTERGGDRVGDGALVDRVVGAPAHKKQRRFHGERHDGELEEVLPMKKRVWTRAAEEEG